MPFQLTRVYMYLRFKRIRKFEYLNAVWGGKNLFKSTGSIEEKLKNPYDVGAVNLCH